MILRLWRARLLPGAEPEFLARLRTLVGEAPPDHAPLDFTYGFRHEAGATHFLSLSVWPDFPSLIAATGGDPARAVRFVTLDDLSDTTKADTFERLPPPPPTMTELSDGRVLGVVAGRVKPNFEAAVQEMIDRSAAHALRAGAIAAHVGRRLTEVAMEVGVVVVWPDRDTLGRFVRGRRVGAIDPQFTDHLTNWKFETYNTYAPGRLLVPPSGPGVLLADDEGRYVQATPGIERVLGIPPELLLGRSVSDLVVDSAAGSRLWGEFRAHGEQHGEIDLRTPDGRVVRVQYRAAANVTQPGQHASVLLLPGEQPDPRSVAEIVSEALARDDAAVSVTMGSI